MDGRTNGFTWGAPKPVRPSCGLLCPLVERRTDTRPAKSLFLRPGAGRAQHWKIVTECRQSSPFKGAAKQFSKRPPKRLFGTAQTPPPGCRPVQKKADVYRINLFSKRTYRDALDFSDAHRSVVLLQRLHDVRLV